ncbi:4-hydroxy-tetrahydrodipicolinate synthase [Thermococcus sp. M39]|nr:4-hydroxy-tetrahydrodipicolinate synthase [Thermococcus sp. M39]NJE08749.1 4-hydroxy-tetrahydrodipicolinate synthase [Thermococcus sp. M39]
MIEGIYVPHVTPFDDDEEINEEALRELIHYFENAKVSGFVTLGSNGEFPYLSFEEKMRVLKIVCEETNLPVIAGVTENSTRETIRLAKEAWNLGVDALLIAPPYYFKPNEKELFAHYSAIAQSVEAPILIYNVPKFTGINIPIEVIERLVDEYSNIVGIKDSSGSIGRISELIRRLGKDMSILAGTADLIYPALALGAHGAVIAVANVAPRLCVELYTAFLEKKYDRAKRLQLMINYLNEVLVKKYNQISAIKEAMNMLGLNVGYPRMPSLLLDEQALQEIEFVLAEVGLL